MAIFDRAAIAAHLQREDGVPADRAASAAAEIAASWNEQDFDYQTVRDILGDHLTDDDPRPKYVADPLAEAFGVRLT